MESFRLAWGSAMNNQPEWWLKAKELEREDRLAEAEEVIRQAMQPLGYPWPAQFAQLYKERMERLLGSGQTDEAKAAAQKAAHWMGWYASEATSGSEGAMLSYQRDQFV